VASSSLTCRISSCQSHRLFPSSFFLDIDQFKRVNDSLGYLESDAFLVYCAEVLKSTFRDSDIITRIGGDEFVILAQERVENSSEAISTGSNPPCSC
jgi:diguanylate cyclase (GGDEF)-like protein